MLKIGGRQAGTAEDYEELLAAAFLDTRDNYPSDPLAIRSDNCGRNGINRKNSWMNSLVKGGTMSWAG